MHASIELENVAFEFRGTPLLSKVQLAVAQGSAVAIAGRSGCGKSMLLEICGGLQQPQAGCVRWHGVDVRSLTRSQMLQARRRMGYLFQVHALIHNYPVFDNLALPLRRHLELSDAEIRARVMGQLESFGLTSLATMLPDMLSFGQKRSVALARAMIAEPDTLLLDEPTSALDPATTRVIVEMLKAYRVRRAATYIIISHNAFLIRQLQCDVKVLDQGVLMDLADWVGPRAAPVPEIASFLHGELWYEKRNCAPGQNG